MLPLFEFDRGRRSFDGMVVRNKQQLVELLSARAGIACSNLWRWYGRAKRSGIAGLFDATRSDKGRSRYFAQNHEAARYARTAFTRGCRVKGVFESLQILFRKRAPSYSAVRGFALQLRRERRNGGHSQ
jgi:hypothetical protein